MPKASPGQAKSEVPQSSPGSSWEWNAVRYRAAAQLANGTLKDYEIARQAGVSARQFKKWKKQPDFATLVIAITNDAASSIRDEVVASKAGRLRILVDLHNDLLAVKEARAAVARQREEARDWAAGEETGLIVTKEVWGKTNSQEAAVDIALVKQIQSLHEQIVKELNDWDTSVSVRHTGRIDHVHRVPEGLRNLSDDELDALEAIAERALATGDR